MRRKVAAMLLAVALSACSAVSSSLPYKPEVQPPGAFISAAYTVVSDRLRVEIDTGGLRLERAQVIKPGAVLEAQTIEYALPPPSGPIGVGLGVGSFGGLGTGVGTGVGVSTSGVVGRGGPGGGTTIASFALVDAGPSPWRVRVKLRGNDPVDILVGEPAPPR
jgi:hypothetical protein